MSLYYTYALLIFIPCNYHFGDCVGYVVPILKNGDNPQNISCAVQAGRWLSFTYEKYFERSDVFLFK